MMCSFRAVDPKTNLEKPIEAEISVHDLAAAAVSSDYNERLAKVLKPYIPDGMLLIGGSLRAVLPS